MNTKILSIVVPVYNVENYLKECFDVLNTQIDDSCEVIIVNDGSTDKSREICESYCKKNKLFYLINQKNSGLSGARNSGIKKAAGEYIMLVDSDDYIASNAIHNLLALIKNNKPDFFFIRSKTFCDGDESFTINQFDYSLIKKQISPIDCFEKMNSIKDFWFAAWLVVINREFLLREQLFFKEGIFHEDELWVPSVFAKSSSVFLVNEGIYCYRQNRPGSIITNKNIKKELDLFIVIEELTKMCSNLEKKAVSVLNKRIASIVFGRIINYKFFVDIDSNSILKQKILDNLKKLKFGKYVFVYLATRLLGIERMSKILS